MAQIKKNNINKDIDRLEKNKDFVRLEGFNGLRSNVRICLKKDSHNKIVITSSAPGDGKSTCASNLAISFANIGKKVIILDCDLRKPVINKTFMLSNKKGLSDVLSRLAPILDCIQETSYKNLSIISAGTSVPNPSELLSGDEMKVLIENLEEKYDYIIFDCPPINVVSDVIPILELVDGVVLVVRQGKTTYTELEKAIEAVKFAKANLFGIFCFEKPVKKSKYSRYSRYSRYGKYSSYNSYGNYGNYYEK